MTKHQTNICRNIYIFIIAFSTLPLLIFTTSFLKLSMMPELFFWIALQAAADYKPIMLLKGKEVNEITMSFVVQISSIIILGVNKTLWIVILATIIVEVLSNKPLHKVFFNAGQYGLSLLVTGHVFYLIKLSPSNVTLDLISDMPAIIIAVSSYFLLNTFFISAVISLSSGNRFFSIFFSDFKTLTSYFYTLAPISIAVSLLYDPNRPYIILIMIPPVIMADRAIRRYYSLHKETQETLNVLADIIDEKDEYTYSHSVRVAEYARKIAENLKLPLDIIIDIEAAGRVHDLGKINIDNSILKKDGKLTHEENEKIKMHPEIAYRVLKNLKHYRNGAEYVLHHHVYMNGDGYPVRKTEKALPLGSRILAVADSYDAMTTDRPYRKALSQKAAVEELRKCSGSQFDPQVVNSFINVLKQDYGYNEDKEEFINT